MFDGDLWGDDAILIFDQSLRGYVEIDTVRSHRLNLTLDRVLKRFEEGNFGPIFDGAYYEYAFINEAGDTLYTNGYFELWKLNGEIIKVEQNVSTFFEERFDNPSLR